MPFTFAPSWITIGRTASLSCTGCGNCFANVVAAAFERPGVLVDPAGRDVPPGLEARVTDDPAAVGEALDRALDAGPLAAAAFRDRVDAHLDRVASLASDLAEAPHLDAPAPVLPGSTLDDERARYARAARALTARLAQQQAAFADRERDLEDWLRGIAVELSEKDVRFNLVWQKVHQADLLYHFHKERADHADEHLAPLREEIAWLRGVVGERDRQLEAARRRLSDVTRRPWRAIRGSNYEDDAGAGSPPDAPQGPVGEGDG
jgi:hypothetical protein